MNAMDYQVVWEVMKWPLAASLVLPPLLVYLGLHVVEREVIFVDLALAQVATLGTCVALLMGSCTGNREDTLQGLHRHRRTASAR